MEKIGYILLALMIVTSIVYFIEASEEYAEMLEEDEEDQVTPISKEAQTTFFTITGIAYIGVGVLSLKNMRTSYMIAIIGSIGLIVLYTITRVMMYQTTGSVSINEIGIISKVLQISIIGLAFYTLKKDGWR